MFRISIIVFPSYHRTRVWNPRGRSQGGEQRRKIQVATRVLRRDGWEFINAIFVFCDARIYYYESVITMLYIKGKIATLKPCSSKNFLDFLSGPYSKINKLCLIVLCLLGLYLRYFQNYTFLSSRQMNDPKKFSTKLPDEGFFFYK